MNDYETRVRAVEDATRLMRALVIPPEKPMNPMIGNYSSNLTVTLDRYDVLEIARFLLDEESSTFEPRFCGSESPVLLDQSTTFCSLPDGHTGCHRDGDGKEWIGR